MVFAIDEPLLTALIIVLEGVELYMSRVWLEPIDELDERGVLWPFGTGDFVMNLDEEELTASRAHWMLPSFWTGPNGP